MLPKISLVVPSFNASQTIERTLSSIFSQRYSNLELICVDGESSDGTQDILRNFEASISVLIVEKDRCQAEALNKGFRRATGDVFGWLCADDELAPGVLQKVGEYFANAASADVLTGGCLRKFEGGSEYVTEPEEIFFSHLFLKNTIEQPSTFWRRGVHDAVGELSEKLKYAFDWEFWCRMKAAGFNFEKVSTPLSVYNFSQTNLTSTGGTKIAKEMYAIVRQYGPYKGRLAWAYRFLYRAFDLRGFYDGDETQRKSARFVFHVCLRILYKIFDRDSINTYNWNFASRQERGKGW